MTLFQDFSYNKSFSQLARESKFTFNLYRGRVDWRKLEVLDVDRVVRDQDVELLNEHINSVTNCNLESEYDVKILDPNFIKLFKLAQLLIDFLLHCKEYLEHCIKLAYENLQTSNKEVEILRKQVQARKSEVKQLKKKVKEIKQQLFHSPGIFSPTFECSLCGKFFMGEKYLESHHSRRHAFTPYSFVLKPHNQTSEFHKVNLVTEENKNLQKSENVTNMKKKYQEEIEELKSMFFAEIEKLKQSEESKKQIETVDKVLGYSRVVSGNTTKTALSVKENKEVTEVVKVSPEGDSEPDRDIARELRPQSKEVEEGRESEEWRQRLEDRESVWRARLSALDQQHKKQVQHLQERLDSSQLQGQEMKKELEQRLEEVLSKFEQSQAILESKNQLIVNAEKVQEANISHEKSIAKHQEEYLHKMNVEEIENKSKSKYPPPVQKRKAFVSQKSKTIQDQGSTESAQVKEQASDLVKVIQPGDVSDDDSSSVSVKPTEDNLDLTRESYAEKQPSFIQTKNKISEQTSRSKNKENIITKLLEEEKQNVMNKQPKTDSNLIDNDESSISQTTTETESETEVSEEKQPEIKPATDKRQNENRQIALQEINPKQSGKQLIISDTEIIQQSLQSMEMLLSANPTILQQLREDLEELVKKRLRGLGVDPAWTSLPPVTFRNKMAVLAHQRGITAKNHKVYFTLRDKLNQDADSAVRNRPTQSTADSVLARLRKKAAVIINAAKFTRHMDKMKQTAGHTKYDSSTSDPKPLASSSPHQSTTSIASKEDLTSYKSRIPNVQSEDSLSISSSTSGDMTEVGVTNVTYTKRTANQDSGAYKSALRNAVSTGNLTKKKVLFVDEAIRDDKRSLSENIVATSDSFASRLDNVSVSSLVQEIQLQLSQRSGKPAHSVDLTQPTELPLSQILPLSRSGRELLESQSSSTTRKSSTSESRPVPLSRFGQELLESQSSSTVRTSTASDNRSVPLSSSGRGLLESQSSSTVRTSTASDNRSVPLSSSGRGLLESSSTVRTSSSENRSVPLSQILQKVPVTKPSLSSEKLSPRTLEALNPSIHKGSLVKSSPLPSLVKKNVTSEMTTDSKKPPLQKLLKPPNFSPTHSFSSIGSSLDFSFSPRDRKGSLELDLQDLEDNLRD